MLISTMSIMELSIALAGVFGALGACLHGSKCTHIKIGLTGCECDRAIADTAADADVDAEPPQTENIRS